MITKKYYKLIRVSHADSEYFRITNVSNEIGEFSLYDTYFSGTLEYSTDGVTWETYNISTKPSVSVNPNANIYLRGTNFKRISSSTGGLTFTKDFNIGGNYLSILNYSTMQSVNTIGGSNFYSIPFYNQTHLISAQNLNFGNVTSIGQNGLSNCFYGCSNLTNAPDLSNVTSIGQNGLSYCFNGCSNLTNAPDLSNVTSIRQSGLSNCFQNCSSLTTAPDLSNVTSIGQGGLSNCFSDCSKISTVTAPNISDLTANNVLSSWLQSAGTSATGTKTVNVPTGATIETNSTSGIPSGWTRVDY